MNNQWSKRNLLRHLQLFYQYVCFISIIFLSCGGGFRQNNKNAAEFQNPIFDMTQFKFDTLSDSTTSVFHQ